MPTDKLILSGQIVDVINRRIFPGHIEVKNGKIQTVIEDADVPSQFILPGLIDAHIHVESSMLIPSEFASIAVVHGTVAAVSDPHEIANVLGIAGVKFMIENGKKVPFKFFFGAPSCVPATGFETSGTSLGPNAVAEMLDWKEVYYLSEMMNFPGVLFHDPDVMAKLEAAQKRNMVIDGHAPGLTGEDARKYAQAGISTDHECFTLEEGREKASYGMKILIREGSAARNFDTLIPLIKECPDQIMFCSDDKHPDELIKSHINCLVSKAVNAGYDVLDTVSACTVNPVRHYGLPVGLLQPGDDADLIVVDSLANMNVLQTYIKGVKVAENGQSLLSKIDEKPINRFEATKVTSTDIVVAAQGSHINVIEALDGQIVTKRKTMKVSVQNGKIVSDPIRDVLKMVVLNRYFPAPPSVGFVNGFGMKRGAIASTVAHDSHNIIALGTDDAAICEAINHLIDAKGGIVAVDDNNHLLLSLPVAGLMSLENGFEVARKYELLDAMVKQMGCSLSAPFMTLSFMALLVIPELKLSDKGLFDGNKFAFVSLFDNKDK
ncbi:MAG: adenine deaminase [Bacteroidales bacterium]|nr:adenine deaminase [Bacteroidales bacterium]